MSIEEFAVVVKRMLEEKTGKKVEVSLKERNNGVILHGVYVLELESNMAPVVYLEPLLAEYEQNNRMQNAK